MNKQNQVIIRLNKQYHNYILMPDFVELAVAGFYSRISCKSEHQSQCNSGVQFLIDADLSNYVNSNGFLANG